MAIRNRSRRWRRAAQEAKAIAETTRDAEGKVAMQEIAEGYEATATFAECAAKKDGGGGSTGGPVGAEQ